MKKLLRWIKNSILKYLWYRWILKPGVRKIERLFKK